MNYFHVAAAPFVRAGLPPEASLAAAMASTAKELVEHRVRLTAPSLFEPELSAGLCLVCSLPLGGSRLLSTVEEHYRIHPPFTPQPIRNVGSLVLWELEIPLAAANTRKIRSHALDLCQTTFDSSQLGKAEAALVVVHPEVLEKTKALISKLLARAIIVCPDQLPSIGILRDLESASRAVADLRKFLKESPTFHFNKDAIAVLEELPLNASPDQRHYRVKTAKLSALFFAGRQTLEGGCDQITADDVIEAQNMVFAGEGCECEALSPQESDRHEQEETFFERMMRIFKATGQTEIPMPIVQTRVRRSRKHGAIPVPELLQGLSKRGRIQIMELRRAGNGSGGRAARMVVLPPPQLALTYPPRLALPAPPEQNPILLPAA